MKTKKESYISKESWMNANPSKLSPSWFPIHRLISIDSRQKKQSSYLWRQSKTYFNRQYTSNSMHYIHTFTGTTCNENLMSLRIIYASWSRLLPPSTQNLRLTTSAEAEKEKESRWLLPLATAYIDLAYTWGHAFAASSRVPKTCLEEPKPWVPKSTGSASYDKGRPSILTSTVFKVSFCLQTKEKALPWTIRKKVTALPACCLKSFCLCSNAVSHCIFKMYLVL